MEHTSFTDSSGVLWVVREDGADDSHFLGRAEHVPGTAWLRFESDLEVRRLWHYPDDWRGLSPIQLESLLDRASTVIARFRPAAHRPAVADVPLKSAEESPRTETAARTAPPKADWPGGARRPAKRHDDSEPR